MSKRLRGAEDSALTSFVAKRHKGEDTVECHLSNDRRPKIIQEQSVSEREYRANGLSPDELSSRMQSHLGRFQRYGKLDEIDKAIEYQTLAVDLTPEGHAKMSERMSRFGECYSNRFQRCGRLEDMEKSLECSIRGIGLMENEGREVHMQLSNLGVSYRDRYRRLGEVADLQKAIECDTRALELTPDGHPDLSGRHASLGVSYTDRYRRLGEVADLRKAIECHTRALELTPDDHPDLSSRHASLGWSYNDRYKRLGEVADLQKAIECDTRALELTPDGHPDSSSRHLNHAISYHHQYQRTSHTPHLTVSLCSFRKASQLQAGSPRDVFDSALRWADLASIHTHLSPMEAFRVAIDLLPHFTWLGATTTQQYHDLSLVKNIAVRAAFTAICSSEYSQALEWLEHARCVVWNRSLMLRSPVDSLALSYPDLAHRLQTVSRQLHCANSELQPSGVDLSSSNTIEHRHRLARQYSDVVSQVRDLPGFGDFLQRKKVNDLTRAACHGPIVVINCYEQRCDALIILPGKHDISHLPLPGFTDDAAQRSLSDLRSSLRRSGIRERGFRIWQQSPAHEVIGRVLATLWHSVVKPVLDLLAYTHTEPSDRMPHITWCPTGALSFLPLHAAGDYDLPRSRVFDYVVSSYTPTLTALLTSTSTSLSPVARVLAIGQADTPGHAPLPGTTTELAHVKTHTASKVQYTQLTDDQATVTDVLDAMEQHDWVHLACHASQNLKDPNKSGFHLHSGTLDLAAINQRTFRSKGLAFLSACQTAMGDEKLPDEVIHLASGMLMAGYRSVIATMWSVMDDDAPFIADKVYESLMKDGKIGNGEAGRALHDAVAGLRNRVGEKKFGRWVPYIHVGS